MRWWAETRMFSKILIANRGEIAVRIIRACREMGISTVAVYSSADAQSLHVALADEAYCIGASEASCSYLNAEAVLSAALVSGAQAIHPGYGFLSENPEFARLCRKNGIMFIGPDAKFMSLFGDKAQAKQLFASAGLDVIPGAREVGDALQARALAEQLGYPVMLKAKLGGGGRGIRLVKSAEEMSLAFAAAASEASSAFGNGALYIEKYIHPARHIEIQVLADEAGNVVCLGERDCSIQRKNQKLIEETPSPALGSEQRSALFDKVRAAVHDIGYTGAGTLEFLFDGEHFYFMEMNVRLQVEHSVTEMLTRIDIVKWQIRIAAGLSLGFTQADVPLRGSAIECRINAAAPGTIEYLHLPGGPGVRFDSYLDAGSGISAYYDSLLGKLVVYAGAREEAIRKMKSALCELIIRGVPNNTMEQTKLIDSADFMSGRYDLDFVAKQR